MNPLVECIPNFSEGRRPEVVARIVNAIRATPGARLLDFSSDADHNRTVVTFAGDPASVEEGAFAAIKQAAALIDMTQQRGEHPRIGATDVVPFVPLRDIEMDDCVQIARRLGARVGDELGIPVYLYEAAAMRPERENLAAIRKGEYERLCEDIGSTPDCAPDFGPRVLGPAGATAIGARGPLIAYNLYLDTDDVTAAKAIARAIRHSGGGLPHVKAMGVLAGGKAQVSMNLTDYRRTPIQVAQEMVRVEAAKHGHRITHAELVGLVPEEALVDSARRYLQLEGFDESQILERRLAATENLDAGVNAFLDALSAGSPTPGGGSAAALAGALAASLAGMAARLTLGKEKYAGVETEMQEAAQAADSLRISLVEAISRDAAAYEALLAAIRMPEDDASRPEAVQAALMQAAKIPLEVARMALDTLAVLDTVAALGNANTAADAAVGAHMARAAIEGSSLNVRVNATGLTDSRDAGRLLEEIAEIQGEASRMFAKIVGHVETRAGLAS